MLNFANALETWNVCLVPVPLFTFVFGGSQGGNRQSVSIVLTAPLDTRVFAKNVFWEFGWKPSGQWAEFTQNPSTSILGFTLLLFVNVSMALVSSSTTV